MNEEHKEPALIALEAIVLFFYNYTVADIHHLRAVSRDFDHVWQEYIEENADQDTFKLLWECWQAKFSVTTKMLLMEYAYLQQGDFASRKVKGALRIRQMAEEARKGGQPNG